MHDSMKSLTMVQLLEFYGKRQSGFADRCKGATEQEIRVLEELAGRPFPADYTVFLKTAGHDCGDMFTGTGRAWSSPTSFTEFSLKHGTSSLLGRRRAPP